MWEGSVRKYLKGMFVNDVGVCVGGTTFPVFSSSMVQCAVTIRYCGETMAKKRRARGSSIWEGSAGQQRMEGGGMGWVTPVPGRFSCSLQLVSAPISVMSKWANAQTAASATFPFLLSFPPISRL